MQAGAFARTSDIAEDFYLCSQERREYFQHLIYLLKNVEHYELALIDEAEEQMIPTALSWELAGEGMVLLLSCLPERKSQDRLLDQVLHEPIIVHAFREYMASLQEQIAPDHRRKHEIISWLEQQISLLDAS